MGTNGVLAFINNSIIRNWKDWRPFFGDYNQAQLKRVRRINWFGRKSSVASFPSNLSTLFQPQEKVSLSPQA